MDNKKEFEALRDLYYYLSLPTTDIIGKSISEMTGMGSYQTCSLCNAIAPNHVLSTDGFATDWCEVYCNPCEWLKLSGDYCYSRTNATTFDGLDMYKDEQIYDDLVDDVKYSLDLRYNLMAHYIGDVDIQQDVSLRYNFESKLFTITSTLNDHSGTGSNIRIAMLNYIKTFVAGGYNG